MTGTGDRVPWLMAVAGVVAGCSNPADVTLYEAGVYKGTSDPLVEKTEQGALQPELRNRLVQGQTDR